MPNLANVYFAAIPHFTIKQIPRNHLCPILRVCLATVGGVAPRGRAKLLLEKALHVHLEEKSENVLDCKSVDILIIGYEKEKKNCFGKENV